MGLIRNVSYIGLAFSLITSLAFASTESARIQNILTTKQFVRAGDSIFGSAEVIPLYNLRAFEPLWYKDSALQPKAYELKTLLQNASRHGLRSQDYWTPRLDSLFSSINANNWISFELLATEAYVRYATHLSHGRILAPSVTQEENAARFSSQVIDDDVKYKQQPFTAFDVLNNGVNGTDHLIKVVDTLAPQNPLYQRMVSALYKLRQVQAQKTWGTLTPDGTTYHLGDSSPMFPIVKRRLTLLGYYVGNETEIYDDAMAAAVMRYRDQNKLKLGTDIGQSFFDRITVNLSDRIAQLETNLEKLRWMGSVMEPNYVFVNTGFQELKVIENGAPVMAMRTVNGQVMRHTPIMKDAITYVELNPTWTVPDSIFFKNKIPLLQKDPNYLKNHNMKLYTLNGVTGDGVEVDPTTIDWTQITTPKQAAKFYVVQGPGMDNALGVVKFPLQNRWSIYLHDSNERNLFAQNDNSGARLLSSGCIRLEKPMELAAYLLRDQPKWTIDALRSQVPSVSVLMQIQNQPIFDPNRGIYVDPITNLPVDPTTIQPIPTFQSQEDIFLKKSEPLYLMYMTADVNENGEIRFVDDIYGFDVRIRQLLAAQAQPYPTNPSMPAPAGGPGTMIVNGQAGPSQLFAWVKVQRCDKATRLCDAPLFLNLNTETSLPAGNYFVGFENSIYPGMVAVQSGLKTSLDLQRLDIPAPMNGQAQVRVFRDFSNPIEMNKTLYTQFYTGRSFFDEGIWDFGDLYLSAAIQKPVTARLSYDYCKRANLSPSDDPDINEVVNLCTSYNAAAAPSDLTSFFRPMGVEGDPAIIKKNSAVVDDRGKLVQTWIMSPGLKVNVQFERQLVSAPLKGTDFVAVFPGFYRVLVDGQPANTLPLSTGTVSESW